MNTEKISRIALVPLALLVLLVVSCSKSDERRSGEGGFNQSTAWAYDSADSFWNKQPCVDFQLDTVWMGDTTINI